jgi:uncharacterized repeat protein (TIGR03803 family)
MTEGYDARRLIVTPSGDLLGLMADGGPEGAGTIFRLTLDGSFETLHAFELQSAYPPGTPVPPDARYGPASPTDLAIGSDGKVYGITSIGGPIEASFFSRFTYGTFFRLEDSGDITVLSEFHPYRQHVGWLVPMATGFIGKTDNKLIKIGLDGSLGVEADFTSMGASLWPHVVTSNGIYGVSPYGGQDGGGFVYRTIPGVGTSIIQNFPASYRPYHPALGVGNDGLVYGMLDYPYNETPPLPHVFRIHESTASPNFPPVAAPDEVWLPRKASNGKREVVIDILGNDLDPDSDPLTIAHVNGDLASGVAELIETPQGVKLKFSTEEEDPRSRLLTYMVTDSRGGLSKGYVAIKSPTPGYFSGYASGGEVLNAPLGLSISKTNLVVATFNLNGAKYSGQGTLDADDTACFSLSASGQTLITLRLKLQRGVASSIEATIRNGEAAYYGICTAPAGN